MKKNLSSTFKNIAGYSVRSGRISLCLNEALGKKKVLDLLLVIITSAIVLFSFAFALRLVPSQVTFGYDQARDAYEANSIWQKHDLKILGPSSDVPGLNHGVLWYYFLALAYGISQGNPEVAAIFTLFLLYLFIPVMGIIAYKITENYRDSLMSVALYSFAPLSVAFSHWLSNPMLALLIAPPLLLLIWMYLKKQNKILALFIGLSYGLLIQSDFAFLVLLLTIPFYIYFFKLKVKISDALMFSLGLLIALSTFILSYIKFQTNIIQIISSFLVNNTGAGFSTSSALLSLVDWTVNIFSITFLPFPKLLVFALLLFLITYKRKEIFNISNKLITFLLIWLSGSLFLFIFNRGNMSATFLYSPFLFSGALLIGLILNNLIRKDYVRYSILAGIVLFQALLINSWTNRYYTPLSIQLGITTKFEKEIVNYTYNQSEGKNFIINTITNPLYINTTWAYLYEYYGKNKYGYLPYWGGRSQVGYLGNLSEKAPSNVALRYLIIEPQDGIQEIWKARIIYDEDRISDIIERKKFGNYEVQKRIINLNKGPIPLPDILQKRADVLKF